MSYQVKITSRAMSQLTATAIWWAKHHSIEQAARWLDGFEIEIQNLADDPERHPLARENSLFESPYPVRQLNYGLSSRPTHRAVFEIRGNTIYVVAIRHLAQDDLPAIER